MLEAAALLSAGISFPVFNRLLWWGTTSHAGFVKWRNPF
jgi:hypothetical protein